MSKTDTDLTRQQFLDLLDSNGSNAANWPSRLQQSIDKLLTEDAVARDALTQAQELDKLLGKLPAPEFPGLALRIGKQPLPERKPDLGDRLLNWLLPGQGLRFAWRPALAACLPLLFGIVVGNYFQLGVEADYTLSNNWDDELTMLSLTDYSQNQVEL